MSVPQIDPRWTRIRTSFGPISGTGTSSRFSPGARSRFTKAGIVLLTASKLVERRPSAILFPFRACLCPCHFGWCANARDARARHCKTIHAALRFYFSVWEHARSLVDRARDNLFRVRTRLLRPDRNPGDAFALGILPHARPQRPAEFQSDRDDLRRRDVVRQLLLFLTDRSRPFLRLRSRGPALFPSDGLYPA